MSDDSALPLDVGVRYTCTLYTNTDRSTSGNTKLSASLCRCRTGYSYFVLSVLRTEASFSLKLALEIHRHAAAQLLRHHGAAY